ncbi:MAG: hypothetical protein KUG78_20395 [Kangiellaceae bacterium]|nr:hypothetical protein [Kangiellaceae bacterium]
MNKQLSELVSPTRFLKLLIVVCLFIPPVHSFEFDTRGLIELEYSAISTDAEDNTGAPRSFADGGYGKFAQDETAFSLSQAALSIELDWDNNFSARVVAIGYLGKAKDGLGITEAYLKYKSLPSESGIQFQSKAGFIYPKISLENTAIGWSSPFSLRTSLLNSWVGEEVRYTGVEGTIKKLGRFSQSDFDIELSASLFKNNDTNGTLLSWHGWTQSNRQTLWGESIQLPNSMIRANGSVLSEQANASKPFVDIDGRFGVHINGQLKWKKGLQLSIGRYDNRARPYLIDKGQYGWNTRFNHLGVSWKFASTWTLLAQKIAGSTMMQSPVRTNVVYTDFSSRYILLSNRHGKHRYTLRYENFKVIDLDSTHYDDNNESGHGFSIGHSYRINKHWFLLSEIDIIDSDRFSRSYHQKPPLLIERQYSVAVRYFF